jgi:aspartyl-tRNA(Asn)/glutamyl-tRNA(Gln) amidotransferase subunit C
MDSKMIEKLEALSKLRLDDGEREMLASELDVIIEYFGLLGGLDTDSVEPADTFGGLVNVMRSDEVAPSADSAGLLSCATDSENGAFTVPKTVE